MTISGKVTDSLQTPLSYANILAIPEQEGIDIAFAITDDNGLYKLKLEQQQTYELTISYLGFKPQKLNITATTNLVKDFVLSENSEQLKTIELNYTPPVSVKKDTITYKVDAFVTGEERKLREVLKKLPGVEVDRVGNVTVQGKKVTKVLVEDKTFFTGNSKLAVNNIPADAVDKVEILDNYNEVAMLKGLQDSEDMAMNIKLKEDKKKFVFGDVEAGVGIKERYVVHPNLFYYSPKTNVNTIADLNNTGVKSFTFSDYLEFEGGFGKLLNDASSYFSLFNSDFAHYLNNQDFKSSTNQFGAFNIRQSLSNVTDISAYAITSNSNTNTQQKTINEYVLEDNSFIEQRSNINEIDNFFTIGKLTLDYDPNYKTDFAFNSFVKATNNDAFGNIITESPSITNTIQTTNSVKAINLKQNISLSKKLSKNHTATLEATHTYQNDKPITNWLTNKEILQGLIPLEDDVVYDILQTKKAKAYNFNAIVKDYWVLNNFNHVYTSVGVNVANNSFYNKDVQQLSDGTINDFASAGFGNDFNYKFNDLFLGLEYKFQIGIATFKPAVYAHYYQWTTKQFNDKQSFNKTLLLPQFTSKIEFSNSENINIRYNLNASFPTIDRLANNFILSSFNTVFKGNEQLKNQLYHTASLSYNKFSMFRNININASISYNKKVKSFKNVTELNGIEQFTTQTLFERPEQTFGFGGIVAKKINKIRYKLKTRFNISDFYQIVNDVTTKNKSKSSSTTISAESFFKDFPNLEIGYTKDFSNYETVNGVNKFENDALFAFLQYDFFKDFIFKADYTFDSYKNKSANIKNNFDTANASLFYQKEDNPWGFELAVSNLFDVSFKQQNSFSSFLISDSKTFILPRIIMFKLSYKL
ncbi:MAG: carboxypeptidase-like regulatory domain-containing protein [Flavobacteriaceae bacterium]|nr:carboxypeptidase-like regulatory domain-containing protein [Flavobacteriaceae bacterium]